MTEQVHALAALCKSPVLTKGWVSSRFGFDVKEMRKILSHIMQFLVVWFTAILITELP
jgi:hypothetical protein